MLNDRFCEIEKRELNNRIDELIAANTTLKGQIDNANQTAAITNYVNSLVTPLANTVNEIKAAQPATVTLPTNQYVAIPNCGCTSTLANLYGYNPYGSIWS